MNLPLFSEFSPASKEIWKQQTIKDLKGKDFEATLLWNTAEGIVVEPYYGAEDLADERFVEIQASQAKNAGWLNQPQVEVGEEKATNSQLKALLQKGVDALTLDLTKNKKIELTKLLDGIKLSETPVFFQTGGREVATVSELLRFIPYQMKGGLADDGLARWTQTGELSETYFEELTNCIRQTQTSPQFRTVCVSSHAFHNAGANIAQELAFTLSSAVTFLDKLTDEGLAVEKILPKVYFSLSIGTNYFLEIAKLRALRYLWERICGQFLKEEGTSLRRYDKANCYIHAQTSTFYDAATTPNTNMLRATTEAMSAVMGGCDALTVHAYDAVFQESDEFSERIARNISILLKGESYLDKTIDPAAGSYYLENLTLQLADEAWKLFLAIEEKGGFMEAIAQNIIQEAIEENFQQTLKALEEGKRVMVGVNKFRFDDDAFVTPPAIEVKPIQSAFKLLVNRRIAQSFEV
ncbi:methylmalonyl-CoA mutase subunit beta [Runella sp. SP2]|uniref:methylmalonyl-CoA mutase subunit beta n=1 Tax=Runella sp. SP2 TaxID=2268026 RepID=UPI000F07AEF0|nr:methylmalonyl-CoA mutase subunit beta [Runella sp. SP2]AYQ31679.1 methylmalonyl-CoA mutase [Runella sp. SP2]